MVTIELEFDKDLLGLYGFDFGKQVYKEQVEPKIKNNSDKVDLVFPENILAVASSFVKGFFEEELKYNSLDSLKKKYDIVSETKGFKEDIWLSF